MRHLLVTGWCDFSEDQDKKIEPNLKPGPFEYESTKS